MRIETYIPESCRDVLQDALDTNKQVAVVDGARNKVSTCKVLSISEETYDSRRGPRIRVVYDVIDTVALNLAIARGSNYDPTYSHEFKINEKEEPHNKTDFNYEVGTKPTENPAVSRVYRS